MRMNAQTTPSSIEPAEGDGLRIFPGKASEPDGFLAVWRPDASLAGTDEAVAEHWIWAALDCPSSAPAYYDDPALCLLGRLTVRTEGPVAPEEPQLVASWRLGREGSSSTQPLRSSSPRGSCAQSRGRCRSISGGGSEHVAKEGKPL